jgi:GNAT superfamily N-acetyltransferase
LTFSSLIAESVQDVASQLGSHRSFLLGFDRDGSGRRDLSLLTYRSGIPHAGFNGVVHIRGRSHDEAIAEAHRRLDGSPWLWWIGPDLDLALTDALLARGATEFGRLPIMAIDLTQLAPTLTPDGVEISRVDDPDEIAEFVAAYAAVSGIPPEGISTTTDCLLAFDGNTDGELIKFTARFEGRVIGTSAAWLSNGAASVYLVTTHPEYRRLGIGTALTASALGAGKDAGLRIGTLSASTMAESAYRKVGFVTVAHYRLLSPSPESRRPASPQAAG